MPSTPISPILGIDPGLRRTGYALLRPALPPREVELIEAGVIAIDATKPLAQRLVELENGLRELRERHSPVTLVCEQLYAHYKHPRTAILMGHARGVILAFAARSGLDVLHIASTNVKKMLTGNGHAGKAQVQRAVAATLRLARLPEPHDVADAIAIGLCGVRHRIAMERLAKNTRGGRI